MNNEAKDIHFLNFLQRWKDGALDEQEQAAFEEQLKNDPEKRQLLLRLKEQETAIAEYFRIEAASQSKFLRYKTHKTWGWIGAAAAAFTITFASFIFLSSRPATTGIVLSHAKTAVFENQQPKEGDSLEMSTYQIKAGNIRVETDQGVTVTIGGPAKFKFLSNHKVYLDYGRITARMHRDGAELTVYTSDMKVTDLGTAFGVHADKDNGTLVSVFEGEVEAQQIGENEETKHLLQMGDSLQYHHEAQRLPEAIPYTTTSFADLWPLTLGIDDSSSQITFIPPGPVSNIYQNRDDSHLFLLPERQGIVAPEGLRIDMSAHGPSFPDHSLTNPSLMEDHLIDSFLLFFNPVSDKEGTRSISGEIEFSRPIVAVIAMSRKLRDSDDLLGNKGVDYGAFHGRGLERKDMKFEERVLSKDELLLSPDSKRLYFSLHAGQLHDYVRILVKSNEQFFN